MRLKVSGDKFEIRQSYLPALFPYIISPLIDTGTVCNLDFHTLLWDLINVCLQSAVEEVIERMDEYYLSREDWDTVVELGVGDRKDDVLLKKIPATTKAAFTRK
jgi:replication factor C subunit 1